MPEKGTKYRKFLKMCVVCGKEFAGTDGAQCCTPACRVRLVRLKAAKRRPEYILMAKGKGQKVPDLNAPKGVKLKKGEKMQREPLPEKDFKAPDVDVYDAPPIIPVNDEAGQFQKPALTPMQKLERISEIRKKMAEINSEVMPRGMLPKMWGLHKADLLRPLEDELKKLHKL